MDSSEKTISLLFGTPDYTGTEHQISLYNIICSPGIAGSEEVVPSRSPGLSAGGNDCRTSVSFNWLVVMFFYEMVKTKKSLIPDIQ